MTFKPDQIDVSLGRLEQALAGIHAPASMRPALERWRSDAAALRFHLRPAHVEQPLLVAILGGTGAGKSTLANRLLSVEASATSFRRTFTAGVIAIARETTDVPSGWLGIERVIIGADRVPARGEGGALLIVPASALSKAEAANDLLARAVLLDTPDLDGDQPLHHAEANRAFRWAQAAAFLVTPEKYQMTELLPYYRLALRYELPVLFVMNKCEEQAVVEDYRTQLQQQGMGKDGGTRVYAIGRDDAAYQPPEEENLAALRNAISQLASERRQSAEGLAHRAADVAGRLEDQILAPLRQDRREADQLIQALEAMETPAIGVDVNPVTQELERRLQQRSVLYLMGPQRVLDRVRQAPAMLARLPRFAWDYVMRGEASASMLTGLDQNKQREVPDFKAMLTDQFSVLQSRIDDLLRTSPCAQKWIAGAPGGYQSARIGPENAGKIAEEELADLREWLEKRWNATPRDTRALQSLLKYLPGGSKLTGLTESAPYLLTIALIAHHALFGTDLLVLGGYTVATWLTERLSNEVAVRTRAANSRIADRFTRLAHEQIRQILTWIAQQAVPQKTLKQLEELAEGFTETASVRS